MNDCCLNWSQCMSTLRLKGAHLICRAFSWDCLILEIARTSRWRALYANPYHGFLVTGLWKHCCRVFQGAGTVGWRLVLFCSWYSCGSKALGTTNVCFLFLLSHCYLYNPGKKKNMVLPWTPRTSYKCKAFGTSLGRWAVSSLGALQTFIGHLVYNTVCVCFILCVFWRV